MTNASLQSLSVQCGTSINVSILTKREETKDKLSMGH